MQTDWVGKTVTPRHPGADSNRVGRMPKQFNGKRQLLG